MGWVLRPAHSPCIYFLLSSPPRLGSGLVGSSVSVGPTGHLDFRPWLVDFFVWSEVERRLRKQELKMKAEKKETRDEFRSRLRRTARAIPRSLLCKAIGDMARRAKLLYKAKGQLFDES